MFSFIFARGKVSRFWLTAFLALCVSGNAFAQSLPTAAAGPVPDGLSTEVTTSADYFRGNSGLLLLGGSALGRYKQGADYAGLFLSTGYASAKSERLLNAVRALGRYRHALLPFANSTLGVEVFGHFERSEQRRHLALFEMGLGPYVQWYEGKNINFNTTVGYAFEYEKFSNLTDPNDADVLRDGQGRPKARGRPLTDAGVELNSHRAWIASEFSWLIKERVRIAEDLITMVPLDHCPCDTRVFSETAVRVIATEHFSMQTSMSVLYDAAPARLVTSIDAIVKGGFVFTF